VIHDDTKNDGFYQPRWTQKQQVEKRSSPESQPVQACVCFFRNRLRQFSTMMTRSINDQGLKVERAKAHQIT